MPIMVAPSGFATTNPMEPVLSLNCRWNFYDFCNKTFFRQGEFQPASKAGRRLLTHELTHVVQQRGGNGQGSLAK
ncbi:MAG TPA: DUF4157 domain-containing protein, partial [Desulfurivibrio alkaliphilus]|nr:DUF4157 domain-containing protein [Desulfurivibrio alkaliphilus]